MKDDFGNTKPVLIELNECWFNGGIIVWQEDFRLPTWISFIDSENSSKTEIHFSKSEDIKFALDNPFLTPDNLPVDYISIN